MEGLVGPPKRYSSFGADVCHSSPFLDNLHFDDFVKTFNLGCDVDSCDEMFEIIDENGDCLKRGG